MSSDPEAGSKLRKAIEEYALKEDFSGFAQKSDVDAVLACFLPDPGQADQLRSVIVDGVFRYLFATASQIFDRVEGDDDLFNQALDQFLHRKTRLTGGNVAHFRRYLKQAVLTSRMERPKSEVRERLLRKQRNSYCYLCGTPIGPHEDERLDHVWPVSAGGGTGKANLLRAHAQCEAAKADLAVVGDAAVGRFAFTTLPRQLEHRSETWWPREIATSEQFNRYVDDYRAAQLRVALLRRQDFRCYHCRTELREAGEVTLERKDSEEPWWFPNTIAVCTRCSTGGESCLNTKGY